MERTLFEELAFAKAQKEANAKVELRIPSCSTFKIGKTGDTLYNRLNNYDGEYDHIAPVYIGSKSDVDDMESYLIDKYINHPKCDNKKDGEASNNDTMAEDAEKYQVYVVWNL
jgi:hypothetical protein